MTQPKTTEEWHGRLEAVSRSDIEKLIKLCNLVLQGSPIEAIGFSQEKEDIQSFVKSIVNVDMEIFDDESVSKLVIACHMHDIHKALMSE